LRARCWGVISSELCIDHLLEERREVGADTGLPHGGESIPNWTLAKITYGKTFDKVNTPGE
jgi:hypothetical protein